MNIGVVNEYFPPFAPGGAEWSTLFLAQRLAQTEHVVVITPNYGAPAYEECDGLITERYAFPFKLGQGQRMLSYGSLSNPLFYGYSALQIARRVKKHRLGILHAHNKQSIVGTVLAGWWTGVPVVVSLRDLMVLCRYGMCLNDFDRYPQGCDLESYRKCLGDYISLYMPKVGGFRRALLYLTAVYHRLDTALKQAMLRRAGAVVTPSDKMRAIYASRGVDADKLVTVYNPLPEITPPARAQAGRYPGYQILYAGKLSWGKGPHLLIEALPLVSGAISDRSIQVIFAGQGPLRAYLEKRATELGCSDQVTFAGQLPKNELQKLYSRADVVVVPSIVQEAFGRVALEALVSGTPVVASSRGGLPEIVEDGVTGLVVDPLPQPLAEAIVRVLQWPDMRTQVRESLPSLRLKFGSDVVKTHLDLYARLLAGVVSAPAAQRER